MLACQTCRFMLLKRQVSTVSFMLTEMHAVSERSTCVGVDSREGYLHKNQ
jgi:hypothetical protein